jgi:integrase/recombinase XerD
MIPFKTYLLNRGDAINTIRARENTRKEFTNWHQKKSVKYADLMDYVSYCKEKGNTVHTIRLKIKNLEHYFDYLICENKLKKNPATQVQIRGSVRKIPHRLLSAEELNELYTLQTTFGLVEKRNKVLLSLVVFQAVGSAELGLIELKDVDLSQGTIYVPATRASNARKLELKAHQLLLIQDYLVNTRPAILQKANKQSDYFLINHGKGKNILSNVISGLLKQLSCHYPKLNNLQQIRQSVITIWLREQGLRKTQYMAGHRYVSSTERYNVDRIEGLKKELKMCYAFKK